MTRTKTVNLIPFLMAVLLTTQAKALYAQVAGGESGYDESLEAIEPDDQVAGVGLAGELPADIGRFLIAENERARSARISPDGNRIAFSWSISGEPQLWVMPVEGGKPRRLTYGTGIRFFQWTPDGASIIYGADDDGNEQEAYFTVSPDGESEKRVVQAVSGGFRAFGDFLNSTEIVYASTERNRIEFDLYTADIETGEVSLISEGGLGFYARSSSPDGRLVIVSQSVGEDSNNLHLLDVGSGTLNEISAPERRASQARAGFAWKSDGSGFYLATNIDRNYAALAYYSLRDGLEILESPDADVESVRLCGENSRFLVWSINDRGYSHLFVRDLDTDELIDTPNLPEGVFELHCSQMSERLAITVSGWNTPGDIFVFDLAKKESYHTFKSDLAGLVKSSLVRPLDLSIPARDGVQLQGLLYLPSGSGTISSRTQDKNPPVIFIVHGGPTSQSRPAFDPIAQYHAGRGLAVFLPNIRGSRGFGHTYVTLDDREKRLDSIRDLVDMLDWLGVHQPVDVSRAAVVGGSYGGYAVNAVLSAFPGHFSAGVSLYGVADWVNALEVASPGLKASDRIEYGDISEEKWRKFYEENSPIKTVGQIDVPVLYSHGVRDPRIDISETEVMVRSLRDRGIEAPFIRIPDEGHGWRKLSNRLFYYRHQAEFLERVLGHHSN